MAQGFEPAWWCADPHLQTLFPHLLRQRPRVALRRERLELPDGDFIDLDWTAREHGPLVIVLHGLEGSSRSKYARGLLRTIDALGWRGLVMHFRGCSGEPNRLPRSYHSGDTRDFQFLVDMLRAREPNTPLAAVGYSLGGNVLLKWLGEVREAAPLVAAVAVSAPLLLQESADRLDRGLSRVYQWALLRTLRRSYARKARRVAMPAAIDPRRYRRFWDFDQHVTAPLHGFDSALHYYTTSSSRAYLGRICVPTLLIHALDDPFTTPHIVPRADELAPAVTLELHSRGGHVGFVSGRWPWRPHYWLEERIPAYLAGLLRAK